MTRTPRPCLSPVPSSCLPHHDGLGDSPRKMGSSGCGVRWSAGIHGMAKSRRRSQRRPAKRRPVVSTTFLCFSRRAEQRTACWPLVACCRVCPSVPSSASKGNRPGVRQASDVYVLNSASQPAVAAAAAKGRQIVTCVCGVLETTVWWRFRAN